MLSEALRLLRVFHDLKQKDLAKELEVSNSYISEIENGNRTPSIEMLEKYASFFSIPVSSIMFFSEQISDISPDSMVEKKAKNAIANKIITILKAVEARTEVGNV